MPLSSASITYDLSDLVGTDFDPRRIKVWATTNIADETVIDTDGNQIRMGSGSGEVGSDGTGSISVWVPGSGSNPASWQTTIHVDYPDPKTAKGRKTRSFGPFTIAASADLADLVEQQEIPPAYLTTVTALLDGYVADAEAARDQAVDISNISTSDDVMAAVAADTGSDFYAVQTATSAAAATVQIRDDRNSRVRSRRRLAWWFASLANREAAVSNVWVCGDSNGEASGAAYRWLDLMAAGLVSAYPTSGVTTYGRYFPVRHENTGNATPWLFKHGANLAGADTAVFDTSGNYGFGGRSVTLPKLHSDASTQWMELSVAGMPASGAFCHVLAPAGAGSGGIQIYRGDDFSSLQTTFTPSATVGEAASALVSLTASPQTIRVIAQSTGTAAKVNGLFVRPVVASKGINVIDASHAGWSAATYAQKQVTERTTLAYLANLASYIAPDLVILPLTINSALLNQSAASMVAGLTTIMDSIRSASAVAGKVSFLIVTHVDSGYIPTGAGEAWVNYVNAAIALADADTHGPGGTSAVDVLCLGDFFWDPAVDNTFGLFAGDKVHFTESGHRSVAEAILRKVA